MEQFSLEKWLKDKSRKVVTRNGNEAEIIHDKDPLVAIINDVAYNFDNDGKFQSNKAKHKYDLFFADEEEELTEFEKMLRYVLECYSGHEFASESEIETLKLNAKSLLDLARKELEANYYTKVLDDRMVFKSELHEQSLQTAYDMGKQDALKSLPKWKKAKENRYLPDGVVKIDEDGKIIGMDEVWQGEYFIMLQSLKSLPKEE